jgi:hypothetical protein
MMTRVIFHAFLGPRCTLARTNASRAHHLRATPGCRVAAASVPHVRIHRDAGGVSCGAIGCHPVGGTSQRWRPPTRPAASQALFPLRMHQRGGGCWDGTARAWLSLEAQAQAGNIDLAPRKKESKLANTRARFTFAGAGASRSGLAPSPWEEGEWMDLGRGGSGELGMSMTGWDGGGNERGLEETSKDSDEK